METIAVVVIAVIGIWFLFRQPLKLVSFFVKIGFVLFLGFLAITLL
ncbi:MAG: hypothetical protein CFH42_00606 [Alphaproteobacteria bacterium MarineAlpha12_Bin1]|nr:MAG: hypothetical protein CFH42_00606 [Alphaproteobacteria bacterium MarineAlpha12_Bin1]